MSLDPTGIDLDWRLPLVKELTEQGHEVIVILPNTYKYQAVGNNIQILNKYEVDIQYRENIVKNPIIIKLAKYLDLTMHFVAMSNILLRLNMLGYLKLGHSKMRRNIQNIIVGSDVVISANYVGSLANTFEKRFLEIIKKLDICLVGTPLVALSNWYHKSIYPFNHFFVSSSEEKTEIEERGLHRSVKHLGCPAFDKLWLLGDTDGVKHATTKNGLEKAILIIFVNDNNFFFKNLNQTIES